MAGVCGRLNCSLPAVSSCLQLIIFVLNLLCADLGRLHNHGYWVCLLSPFNLVNTHYDLRIRSYMLHSLGCVRYCFSFSGAYKEVVSQSPPVLWLIAKACEGQQWGGSSGVTAAMEMEERKRDCLWLRDVEHQSLFLLLVCVHAPQCGSQREISETPLIQRIWSCKDLNSGAGAWHHRFTSTGCWLLFDVVHPLSLRTHWNGWAVASPPCSS